MIQTVHATLWIVWWSFGRSCIFANLYVRSQYHYLFDIIMKSSSCSFSFWPPWSFTIYCSTHGSRSSRLETTIAVRMNMNRTMISWWCRTGNDTESERIDSQRCMTDHSFIKLFRALHELSGSRIEHHMQGTYVACNYKQQWWESDESRVWLIKNRLLTTMLDDWFSSLMVLVCEKDVLECITIDKIIDKFATLSTPLQKLFK